MSEEQQKIVQLDDGVVRLALMALGLPVTGPKTQQALRLIAAGLTAEQVQEQYAWQARDRTRQDEREAEIALRRLMAERQAEPHAFVPSEENELCAYCGGPEDLETHG